MAGMPHHGGEALDIPNAEFGEEFQEGVQEVNENRPELKDGFRLPNRPPPFLRFSFG